MHIKSLESQPTHRMGLLSVSRHITLNSSCIIITLSQSNIVVFRCLISWPLGCSIVYLTVTCYVLSSLKFRFMGRSACASPETTSLLFIPCVNLDSLDGSLEPHVMAQPTPETQKQRDGEHNLFTVMFVLSHKTEGCGYATITIIEF